MSESKKQQRRQRRSFSPEFKAGAVKLVLEEGKPIAEVARDLDLTETAFRKWVEQAKADRGQGKPGALASTDAHARRSISFLLRRS
ncbi:transposase [Corallococcus sp. AB038B]|uniref:transposase n=1 Tax=Corallococcus sp. AB038B TaxID=2316718 RepID=UPI0013153228|nr:transposase [Corallococcus sp. AB038B]